MRCYDEGDDHDLPDLPNADAYDEIRMRAAPNPNGPWRLRRHAAHRAVVVARYRPHFVRPATRSLRSRMR
ncbi:hypothetical protein BRC72_00820 [Halobacteriales archaeon QH_7_66_36]|nr:MAG: hypothetical protein BRC72_00820 [Halobacteriales archaeon QH_7_66_36]